MPRNVTQYDLLISCPSDVIEELEIIKETVNDFNRMYGSANNISIVSKHWSKDSYPQSGEKPQNLLNKQFVLDCDAAVAVFWTRFGTPTDNYGSGTEEEIEELINSGKQVFLYFSDRQINPSNFDPEQHNKILDFRKRYEDKGIYATYSDLTEFKKFFLNHLSLHFVNILTESNGKTFSNNSELFIKGVRQGKISENPILYKTDYIHSKFMVNLETDINQIFKQINEIDLHNQKFTEIKSKFPVSNKKTDEVTESRAKLESIRSDLQNQFKNSSEIFTSKKVFLQEELVNEINTYAEEFNIHINDEMFFDLGELKKQESFLGGLPFGTGPSYNLIGSDDEKEKFSLLKEVYSKIKEYRQWDYYFSELDSLYYLDLCLTNSGNSYDEDVDIKLFVEGGYLSIGRQVPLPDDNILEHATQILEIFFKPKKSLAVKEYDDLSTGPEHVTPPDVSLYNFNQSYEEKIQSDKEDYWNLIDDIFCYDSFQEEGYDVICYKQSYIKQKTNVYFPSIVIFRGVPKEIRYEISSKYYPEIIEGKLTPILK
ncbi:hypothetical protein [Gracilibacillus lacisalsi]|uniref:hypothetical protein n=1 Tax=Gracilibacillus lacisalsi TaxID=393087 RepID=UPI00036E8A82|nr:hypothetical protein [Gracilibacillus lacisalsi]